MQASPLAKCSLPQWQIMPPEGADAAAVPILINNAEAQDLLNLNYVTGIASTITAQAIPANWNSALATVPIYNVVFTREGALGDITWIYPDAKSRMDAIDSLHVTYGSGASMFEGNRISGFDIQIVGSPKTFRPHSLNA